MKTDNYLCTLLIVCLLYYGHTDEVPPKECYDHKEILDITRSFAKQDTPTSTANDVNLEAGWYRVLGQAGNSLKQGFDKILSTSYDPPNFCGTEYPGTLMGEHPTKEEGLVEITVCFRARFCFFKNIKECECFDKRAVYVRNCGKHYVYWLFPTSASMRYCTGQTAVTEGQKKASNSTPIECKEYKNELSESRIWNRVSDVKCDKNTGWYRFSEEAGTEIASTCTKNTNEVTRLGQSCGAEFRGWLVDRHPGVEEERVQRRVCFSYSDECSCEFFTNIYVRNCGGFFVYRLTKVPLCNARYCGAPPKSLSKDNDVSKPVLSKDEDLCSMHTVLHDPDRLWSYTSPTVKKCDATLYGRYRFGSKYTPWRIKEGCDVTEMAIVTHRCGTGFQGYMIGEHPKRKGELEQRIICFQTPNNPCQCHHTAVVEVKNCGKFFVYDLQGVSQCNSRYCMVANNSVAIKIDANRPPLYQLPAPGYNPVVVKPQPQKDEGDSLVSATTVLSIIVFIILIILVLFLIFIIFVMWPVYKKRRQQQRDENGRHELRPPPEESEPYDSDHGYDPILDKKPPSNSQV